MKLYILRHGQTLWNTQKRMQGQTDILLNEEGIRLAEETGRGMKDIDIDLVISSPLLRARQTAELVMAGRSIPLITDRRIMEMSFGDWEGESFLDSKVLPPEFIDQFYHDPFHAAKPPKGESFQELVERLAGFYRSIAGNEAYRDKNILISTHGAASRALLMNFYEDKEDFWRGGVPKNCAVTIVNVENGIGTVEELDKIFYKEV